MARRNGLIKVAVGLVALGVLGVLFVRSARSVVAEPYDVSRDRLTPWALAIEPVSNSSGILLALAPPPQLPAELFNQVFKRSGESLSGPVPPAMPLVLRSEFDGALRGTLTPEALLAMAREAGLESARPEPRCLATRRVSEPGLTRQVYFVRFDWPTFGAFRQQVARRLQDAGAPASTFDPSALTPVLIVAASDAAFSRWLPLLPGATDDCVAPITVR